MAGSSIYDQIINGSFGAIGMPAPRQAMPGMYGRGLPLDAVSRLPRGSAGIDPIGWTPPVSPAAPGAMMAMAPEMPAVPAVAAATDLANPTTTPITNVQGSMLPKRADGGFLEMLFGPSKNGLSGLPGLLGGPQQGGILQTLFGSGTNTAGLPSRASQPPARVTGDALVARATGATSSAESDAWRRKTFGGDGRSLV